MTVEGQIDHAPPRGRLLGLTAGALAAASLAFVAVVLPAEFGLDPTGFGKASGLLRLNAAEAAKATNAAAPAAVGSTSFQATPYRSDVIEIPLAAGDGLTRNNELEFKVRMKAGDTMVYSWSVPVENPEEFYYDFHGETPASKGAEPKVIEYRQATGTSSNGSLTATIPGVHGWYLQNQSAKPVVVRLRISGFYELVPSGEYGNEAGVEPVKAP